MENFYKLFTENFSTKPGNIVEIGSRDGNDAEHLRKLTGLAPNLVHIVEPHPESAKRIRAFYPKAHVYECAVYEQPGVLKFNALPYWLPLGSVGVSSLLKMDPTLPYNKSLLPAQNWIKVIGITGKMLMELIDMPNLDMVKIDVEGASYEVLNSFGSDIRLIKALHLEFETTKRWETPYSIADSYKLLQFYGFKEVFYKDVYVIQRDSVWVRMGE